MARARCPVVVLSFIRRRAGLELREESSLGWINRTTRPPWRASTIILLEHADARPLFSWSGRAGKANGPGSPRSYRSRCLRRAGGPAVLEGWWRRAPCLIVGQGRSRWARVRSLPCGGRGQGEARGRPRLLLNRDEPRAALPCLTLGDRRWVGLGDLDFQLVARGPADRPMRRLMCVTVPDMMPATGVLAELSGSSKCTGFWTSIRRRGGVLLPGRARKGRHRLETPPASSGGAFLSCTLKARSPPPDRRCTSADQILHRERHPATRSPSTITPRNSPAHHGDASAAARCVQRRAGCPATNASAHGSLSDSGSAGSGAPQTAR